MGKSYKPSYIHWLPRGKGKLDLRRQPQCGWQVRPLDSMQSQLSGSRVHPLLDFYRYYLPVASSLSSRLAAITGRPLALRLRSALVLPATVRFLRYEHAPPERVVLRSRRAFQTDLAGRVNFT